MLLLNYLRRWNTRSHLDSSGYYTSVSSIRQTYCPHYTGQLMSESFVLFLCEPSFLSPVEWANNKTNTVWPKPQIYNRTARQWMFPYMNHDFLCVMKPFGCFALPIAGLCSVKFSHWHPHTHTFVLQPSNVQTLHIASTQWTKCPRSRPFMIVVYRSVHNSSTVIIYSLTLD